MADTLNIFSRRVPVVARNERIYPTGTIMTTLTATATGGTTATAQWVSLLGRPTWTDYFSWDSTNSRVQSLATITPNVNNAYYSGTDSYRWANIYSVLGNFSGAVTMSSTLSVTGTATLSSILTVVSTVYAKAGVITGSKTSANDGIAGVVLDSTGTIEMSGATPFIDFHYNNSTLDYTSRIIENGSGILSVPGKFAIGKMASATDYTLDVAGKSLFSDQLTANAGILRSNSNVVFENTLLGEYTSNLSGITGTMCIVLPNSFSSTMMMFEIDVYEYEGNENLSGYSKIFMNCYDYSTTSVWLNVGASVLGRFTGNIRVAHNGTYNCVLLGSLGHTWKYPYIRIKAVSKFSSVSWIFNKATISIITDESALSKIVTVPTNKFGNDVSLVNSLSNINMGGINVLTSTDNATKISTSTGRYIILAPQGSTSTTRQLVVRTDSSFYPIENNVAACGMDGYRWANIYSVLGNFSGAVTMSSTLYVVSNVTSAGTFISTTANQFRAVYGSYGFFIRNDGSNTYFMLTNAGDPYGSYNSLRPLYISNASGMLYTYGMTSHGLITATRFAGSYIANFGTAGWLWTNSLYLGSTTDAQRCVILICPITSLTGIEERKGIDGVLYSRRGGAGAYLQATNTKITLLKGYGEISSGTEVYGNGAKNYSWIPGYCTYNGQLYLAVTTPGGISTSAVSFSGYYSPDCVFTVLLYSAVTDFTEYRVDYYKYLQAPITYARHFYPEATASYHLGYDSYRWAGIYSVAGNFSGNVISPDFITGFSGAGWGVLSATNHLTVDNLTVRKSMNVYELIINQIRATNGSIWVSDAAKLATVEWNSGGSVWWCTIDTDGGRLHQPFLVGDIVRCQVWTGRGIKYYTAWVSDVVASGVNLGVMEGDIPAAGDEIVRVGSTASTARQGALYLTASDTNNPYMDVLAGVNSASFSGKTVVRLGNLTGITSSVHGALSGYGIYTSRGYFENVYVSGTINVTGGNAARTDQTQAATQTTVDLLALDINTWYPVTILLAATYTYELSARRTLGAEYGIPSYSTHANGFSLLVRWTSTGSGWGTVPVRRTLLSFETLFAGTLSPAGDIGQMTNSSNEYIYLRGGSKYAIIVNGTSAATITLRTTDFTANGQTIGPRTTVTRPAVIFDEKQDAIINGVTLIEGGYINTQMIKALSITSDKINFNYASGMYVDLTGRITATSGLIGGWTIESSYLYSSLAGMSPADYPFYSGVAYASRASAPFRVTSAGVLYATGAIISGNITATTGSIGGWTIATGYLYTSATGMSPADYPFYAGVAYASRASAPFRVTAAGALYAVSGQIAGWSIAGADLYTSTAGMAPGDYPFYSGSTFANRASAPFRVNTAGSLIATGATISGNITASSGTIGGWSIATGYLYGTNAGMAPADWPFYAGTTYASRASAPFRVSASGALYAESATMSGTIYATSGTIGGFTIGSYSLVATSGNTQAYLSSNLLRFTDLYNTAFIGSNAWDTSMDISCPVRIEALRPSSETIFPVGNVGIFLNVKNAPRNYPDTSGRDWAGNCAIYCASGRIVGLRLNVKRITSATYTLTDTDTYLLMLPSQAQTITLPSSPQDGQIYMCRRGTNYTITYTCSAGIAAYNSASRVTSVTQGGYSLMIFMWDVVNNMWWASQTSW